MRDALRCATRSPLYNDDLRADDSLTLGRLLTINLIAVRSASGYRRNIPKIREVVKKRIRALGRAENGPCILNSSGVAHDILLAPGLSWRALFALTAIKPAGILLGRNHPLVVQ